MVLSLGVISLGVMSLGVMSLGVMSLGVMSAIGVLSYNRNINHIRSLLLAYGLPLGLEVFDILE